MSIDSRYAEMVLAEKNAKIKSTGGPSKYYDFPKDSLTLNDLLEYLGDDRWKGDSFHLANIMKAAFRWGTKEGTDIDYDIRKILYSSCRLLMKHVGVKELRKTLKEILDDPQFKERETKDD